MNHQISTEFIKSWSLKISKVTGVPVHDISIAYEAVEYNGWVWAVRVTYTCKEKRKKPFKFTVRAFNDSSLPEACDEAITRVLRDETRIKVVAV